MKKFLLAGSLLTGFAAQAQITPENTYLGTGTMIRLSTGDYKYQLLRASTQLTLYNLNHSIYRQMTVPTLTGTYATANYVNYVSDALFDTTPATIEYAATYYPVSGSSVQQARTIIYGEAGTQLAVLDSASYVLIYNTPAGTKLLAPKAAYSSTTGALLREYTRVYTLAGQLALRAATPTGVEPAGQPYPNPAQQARISLPYDVPAGTTGTLRVYDAAGRTVRTYQVDDHVGRLELSTQELTPGVYLYRVETPAGPGAAQRFVVP